jgi:dimethylargininase
MSAVRALVREVPWSVCRGLSREDGPPPDPSRARAQHDAYVAALRKAGAEVRVLPADEDLPDGCFVEDTVVVAHGVACITRSAVPSRAGERAAVAEALSDWVDVSWMTEGTVDGGDVLRVGSTLYVGLSERTDAAGVASLRRIFEPLGMTLISVPVRGALHLKSVCSSPDDRHVLVIEGAVPTEVWRHPVVVVPCDEPHGCNVVDVGGQVVIPEDAPKTAALLRGLGLSLLPVPCDELRRVDGALTCCSVLVPST